MFRCRPVCGALASPKMDYFLSRKGAFIKGVGMPYVICRLLCEGTKKTVYYAAWRLCRESCTAWVSTPRFIMSATVATTNWSSAWASCRAPTSPARVVTTFCDLCFILSSPVSPARQDWHCRLALQQSNNCANFPPKWAGVSLLCITKRNAGPTAVMPGP